MRLKGISVLERHVEKIVAGVFGVAALGVVALVFTRPATVKVDNQSLSPERAYAKITTKAKELEGRLQETAPPQAVKELAVPDVMALVESRVQKSVAPRPSLPVALGPARGGLDSEVSGAPRDLPRVAVIVPPAPSKPVAGSFGGAIDPLVVATTPGLEALVPESQPYDMFAVSVVSSFPSAAMIERLQADPDGPSGPMTAPPPFWWKGRIEALDVLVERQELQADGSWSEATTLAPMPGQANLREALAAGDGARLAEVMRIARDRRADVVRPGFYHFVAGERWRPPVQAEGAAPVGNAREAEKLKAEIEDIKKKIEDQETLRDKPPEKKEQRKGGGGGGTGVGMASAQPARGGANPAGAFAPKMLAQDRRAPEPPAAPAPPRDPEKAAEERRREGFQKRIAELEKELEKREARLRDIEAVAAGVVAAAGIPELKPIESLNDLVFWAHDPTVKPGASYRYRVRLAVTNPLFGNARQMHPESQAGAEKPAAESEPSPWSDTVHVPTTTQVFFTSAFAQAGDAANVAGPDGMGASVEMWKFYYGFWRRAKATVRPGDALEASIALPKEFGVVWDIEREGPDAAKVVGERPAAEKTSVDGAGFLLDVAPVAGEGGRGWQVIFRDAEGRVAMRRPEQDSTSPERRALEASEAAASQAALGKPGEASLGATARPGQPAGGPNPPPMPPRPAGGLPSGPRGVGG